MSAGSASKVEFSHLFRHTNGRLALGTAEKARGFSIPKTHGYVTKFLLKSRGKLIVTVIFSLPLHRIFGKHTIKHNETENKPQYIEKGTSQKEVQNRDYQP